MDITEKGLIDLAEKFYPKGIFIEALFLDGIVESTGNFEVYSGDVFMKCESGKIVRVFRNDLLKWARVLIYPNKMQKYKDFIQKLIDNDCIKGVGTIQTAKELLRKLH